MTTLKDTKATVMRMLYDDLQPFLCVVQQVNFIGFVPYVMLLFSPSALQTERQEIEEKTKILFSWKWNMEGSNIGEHILTLPRVFRAPIRPQIPKCSMDSYNLRPTERLGDFFCILRT